MSREILPNVELMRKCTIITSISVILALCSAPFVKPKSWYLFLETVHYTAGTS
ncbi:hypothetical protein T4B_1747 [Trichinella pseudospiralis]|uniref:Uncharacterized protein n=2 Tax=Trichinella pseudospiralis TaxID=6337 RepID=A0A0V1IVB6_TRIPS|nr:hypothetical protein T4E_4779 [Trichinella pseudospiralis]KRY77497.1 hypothetical protein T4A_3740 [Trichinella pseudospiralis]KRY89882.1 hypothetical protein T4D_2452 [Trichinella pseudospiralis]KRZ26730.1 hypothetical protein T4B_1747 [Trichinella pseudospiralis]KRZ44686.1 hypothetical protein T4C_3998 [Trichinella pseudospiralis]